MVAVALASAMGAPFAADSRTLNLSFLSRLRSPITTTVNRLWRWRGLNASLALLATKSEPARAVPFVVVARTVTVRRCAPTARRRL